MCSTLHAQNVCCCSSSTLRHSGLCPVEFVVGCWYRSWRTGWLVNLCLPGVAIRLERLLGALLFWVPWIVLLGVLLLNGHGILPQGHRAVSSGDWENPVFDHVFQEGPVIEDVSPQKN
jgi:hypothetical protein